MHLNDRDLGAVLERDRDAAIATVFDRHLERCFPCRQEISDLRTSDHLIGDVLRTIDTSVPKTTMADIRAAAARHPFAAPQRPRLTGTRLAAAALLTFATAAAATEAVKAPWARAMWRPLSRHDVHVSSASGALGAKSMSGVGLAADSSVEVDFTTAQTGGALHFIVGTGRRLLIQASADGPRYVVRQTVVIVKNTPTDQVSYTIDLPAPPVAVIVRVGSRIIYQRNRTERVAPAAVYAFPSLHEVLSTYK